MFPFGREEYTRSASATFKRERRRMKAREPDRAVYTRKSFSYACIASSPVSYASVVRLFGHSHFGWCPFSYRPRTQELPAVCKLSGVPSCRSLGLHKVPDEPEFSSPYAPWVVSELWLTLFENTFRRLRGFLVIRN